MNMTKRIATAIFTASVAFTVVGCSSTGSHESTGALYRHRNWFALGCRASNFERLLSRLDHDQHTGIHS